MTLLISHLAAIAFGILIGAAALRGLGKRQPDGTVSRNFAWPGQPMRIIDAEVLTPDAIDAAVRGD